MKVNSNLIRVMNVQTESYKTERMQRFIKKELEKLNLKYKKDTYGNIYVTKGIADLYPTMVCHIDTVHEINNNARIIQLDDVLLAIDNQTMKRYGIGGDDKVGVYITLEMLKKFDNFKAVFFLDEEVGCVGSSRADFNFFDNSTIVLECDRRGYNDFVTDISGTILSNEELHADIDDILKKYNRDKCSGGITDVGEIAEKNRVQVANMSCGYYDPHSDNEYIVISQVESTLQMCYEILIKTSNKRYEIPLEERIKYGKSFGTIDKWNTWDYDINHNINGYHTHNIDNDSQSHNIYTESFKTTASCPCCESNDVWYDDYENEFFCIGCHSYVDIEDDINMDIEAMDNMSEEDLIAADTAIYDASCNKVKFKKDIEPKMLNYGN
jgi:tripeptide aminopeptidase